MSDEHSTGATSDELTRDECLRHLEEGSVGRISISSRAMPTVLPVRYGVAGDRILFWAEPQDHPAAIADNSVIGFQADAIDPVTHGGWSVMVVGRAVHVRQPEETAVLEGSTPRGWAAAQGPLIALSIDLVSGRRLAGLDVPAVLP
jgi:nitroimidazol reductase NimA-like FMN-containing flavoprotein (pyridoxamine 5'-phosphate oxidase superfamily)